MKLNTKLPFSTIIIFVLSVFIISTNIFHFFDTFTYWDEAETLLHGKLILKNGYPKQTDPDFFHSFQRGAEFGPGGAETYHTWSYLYLVAAIMKIEDLLNLKTNYYYLRILFLLIGLAAILPITSALKRCNLYSPFSILIILLVYTNNVLFTFLFNLKYFSPAILFASVFFLGYINYRNTKSSAMLIFGAVMLYHTQWLQSLPILSIFCSWEIFRAFRNKTPLNAPKKIQALWPWMVIFALTFPHFMIMAPLGKIEITVNRIILLSYAIFSSDAIKFNQCLPLAYLVWALVPFTKFWKTIKQDTLNIELVFLSLLTCAFVIILSTQSFDRLRMRHLVLLLPFYIYLVSFILNHFSMQSLTLKRVLKNNFFITTFFLLYFAINQEYLLKYAIEYKRRGSELEKAISWLRENSRPLDTVYSNSNRETILIHTKLKVVSASDYQTAENGRVISPLPLNKDPTYLPIEKTKWIIWNNLLDIHARKIKTWATPDYVSLKTIPHYFNKVYDTSMISIYKNNY